MGRYEHYKKSKPKPRKAYLTVRNAIIVLILLLGIAGFVIQIVINLEK